MNQFIALVLAASLAAPFLQAGEDTVVEAAFEVSGVCTMCKKRIERAVAIDGVTDASWNRRSHMLEVTFDSSAVTFDSLQRRVATAGHDTEHYAAPDSVYEALPDCCLYRDGVKPH